MKKIVVALLLVVILSFGTQGNKASAHGGDDQLPKIFKTFSHTIQK